MMNKKRVAIFILGAFTMVTQASLILNVSEDATVKMSTPTVNYGSNAILDTTKTSTATNCIYLKFDASGFGGAITDITSMEAFALSVAYPRSGSVYLITNSAYDTVWSQNTITWNNAPGNDTGSYSLLAGAGVYLGTFAPPSALTNQTVAFSFESGAEALLIDALNTGDRIVTLVVIRSTDRVSSYAALESTVTGAHPIRMTVDTIPEPATIGMMGLALAVIGVLRRIRTK